MVEDLDLTTPKKHKNAFAKAISQYYVIRATGITISSGWNWFSHRAAALLICVFRGHLRCGHLVFAYFLLPHVHFELPRDDFPNRFGLLCFKDALFLQEIVNARTHVFHPILALPAHRFNSL